MAFWQPSFLGFAPARQVIELRQWGLCRVISLRGEMSASNHALAWDNFPLQQDAKAQASTAPVTSIPAPPAASPVPALRVMPLLRGPQPRRFVRVPTHAVGRSEE